ncbi:MAG TPA: 30S ribosomal protein S12 methylthiotransferase RimO [Candidatus Ventricola gallistercoris]|nr:30S ribosomal protein S12 methylthiotransferase RimO [Candidatus Ventricola gallistercoris]
MATTVGLISLGCSKNRIDSEQMLGVLRANGYKIVSDPAKAEVIIVNTCGFIQSAKEEAISTLFEMAEYKKSGKCRLLVATGCFAQRYPEAIREEMPEVDAIMGVNEYQKLCQAIEEAGAGARPVYTGDDGTFFEYGRVLTTPRYSAYVRIGEGCDNWCSYCAIPLIRGRYRSRPKEDILSEVRTLAEKGVREFTLIAQDNTRYGSDGGKESRLPELIEEIAGIEGVSWLRTLYCYPERVDERLLDVIARHDNVCKYLDLPMQHISQHILKDMNRRDTSEHIRKVCRMFRERGMMLRTTLMVGFPGETDEDFDELMDFVRETKFGRMGAFMFSPEEGTRAEKMPGQIPEEIKQARYDALMTLQHGISLKCNKARVGSTCRVLVERKRGDRYVGRSEFEAPETDGNIYFHSDTPCETGTFVNVRITGARTYDLMGERI